MIDVTIQRSKLVLAICDALEALTGELLIGVVTANDDDELTLHVAYGNTEALEDTLNGWVDGKVWNAPKSL